MSESARDYLGALEYARAEAAKPNEDWEGYCQMFVRSCYGIPALFGSAWAQWLGADDEDKHEGGDPANAPLGSALLYKGAGPYGHIMLAARDFKSGVAAAWSNDLVEWGAINKVPRTAPTSAWGQGYLGYLTAVNDYDLRLKEKAPAKPKQNKPYQAIEKAINHLERALETARSQGDAADAKVLKDEIRHLKRRYERLRHS